MSKKLAEGIDGLVLDVKTGSGAFMKNEKDAAFLAELMVETGERMGKQVVALITDMDQPLGCMIGNALEVVEVVEVLRGQGPQDLRELCLELAGWMLHLGGVAETVAEGKQRSEKLIASGEALARFRQMVELQGGNPPAIDDPRKPASGSAYDDAFEPEERISSPPCSASGLEPRVSFSEADVNAKRIQSILRWGSSSTRKLETPCLPASPWRQFTTIPRSRADRAQQLLEASYRIDDSRPREARPLIHQVIGRVGGKPGDIN